MRRIVSLMAAALLMTTMLLTLPAASASADTFRDFDLDDLGGQCVGCGDFGFVPQGQFVGGFDGDFDQDDLDFDRDDFGFVPVNQGFFIDEDDLDDFLDDCDFVPGFGFICD